MPHIRLLRHYIHTPFLLMAAAEWLVILCAAYLGYATRYQQFPGFAEYFGSALLTSFLFVLAMVAMGVYESRLREGFAGMMLRTAVSIFLLGTLATAGITFLLPVFEMGRGVLLYTALEGFLLIAVFRWCTNSVLSADALKRRVVVLGTGNRALKIATRMRRQSDQRGFVLIGFLDSCGGPDLVTAAGGKVLSHDGALPEFCQRHRIEEIVVAIDERRRNADSTSGLPIDELVDCRLSGIEVCDIQAFIERESGKVDVDLIYPSWMVFSDGFVTSTWREWSKRCFDIVVAVGLLLLTWPIMLGTAICIGSANRFRDPILYKQERIGLDNRAFQVMKFRSMRVDPKAKAAVWATHNDPRVTKIGAVIRKTRIDELPQLFNVIRGDMSFVGPRPERPVFVDDLNKALPYYSQRHRIKPGITGWAQLCYPYGASVADAKEKLQYDLYYLKNHSLFLDLIILIQTVEVVLVGEGAR